MVDPRILKGWEGEGAEYQPIVWPIFREICKKIKEIVPRGGAHLCCPLLVPPLWDSSLDDKGNRGILVKYYND